MSACRQAAVRRCGPFLYAARMTAPSSVTRPLLPLHVCLLLPPNSWFVLMCSHSLRLETCKVMDLQRKHEPMMSPTVLAMYLFSTRTAGFDSSSAKGSSAWSSRCWSVNASSTTSPETGSRNGSLTSPLDEPGQPGWSSNGSAIVATEPTHCCS